MRFIYSTGFLIAVAALSLLFGNGTARAADACHSAHNYYMKAVDAYNAGNYKSAYQFANAGLTVVDSCETDYAFLYHKGYLLSVKALAERHLPYGDSRTDLNQAMTILEECQTNPRLYGTHYGAGCESQQQIDATFLTQWDIDDQ